MKINKSPKNNKPVIAPPIFLSQAILVSSALVKVAKFFPGCDFCDGRLYDPTSKKGYDGTGMIAAGEQVAEPISYKSYK